MLPVFQNYRELLHNLGLDLSQYDSDKLWIDRLIIRGFSKQGHLIKIVRLKVSFYLNYEFSFYSKLPDNDELETWEETYQRLSKEIFDKEQESLEVIRGAIQKYPESELILSTSMGKDSKLTEHLLSKITKDYRVIFGNTTCDSPDVYLEVKSRPEIEIVTPKDKNGKSLSLYRQAKKIGFATRHHRWCCSIFKEGSIKNYLDKDIEIIQFLGMRNDESNTRSSYEFEKIDDRHPPHWHYFLPIRKWTELELWLYTIHNEIPINSKYDKGYARVGCSIVCPYATKSTWILDKNWYPYARDRFEKIVQDDFIRNEKWTRLNCTLEEYMMNWNGGQVRETPTEEVVLEFMKHKGLTEYELARKFFDKKCKTCGKKAYKRDEIGMSLKYLGRDTNAFYCKKCFLKKFNMTSEQWDEKVADFKQQDCKLF